MTKIFFLLFLSTNLLFSATNIDKKIQKNKQILDSSAKKEETTSLKIKELADKIESQNSNIINLEKNISIQVFFNDNKINFKIKNNSNQIYIIEKEFF